MTFYALPYTNGSVGSTYTSMAGWIYQPTSLATASGSANKSVETDVATGMTGLTLGQLGSGYGGLNGPPQSVSANTPTSTLHESANQNRRVHRARGRQGRAGHIYPSAFL